MTPDDLVVTPRGVRFQGQYLPCTIGRGGLSSRKSEGDGATPLGVHRIVGMLYRPDRLAQPASWAVTLKPRDLWSDDPRDPDYNHMVGAPHAFRHEVLRRADPLYDLVLITDWNWPHSVPGRGSAIFVHRWRRLAAPTEGCVALRPDHLRWLVPRITLQTRLIIAGAASLSPPGAPARQKEPTRRGYAWPPGQSPSQNHHSSP